MKEGIFDITNKKIRFILEKAEIKIFKNENWSKNNKKDYLFKKIIKINIKRNKSE